MYCCSWNMLLGELSSLQRTGTLQGSPRATLAAAAVALAAMQAPTSSRGSSPSRAPLLPTTTALGLGARHHASSSSKPVGVTSSNSGSSSHPGPPPGRNSYPGCSRLSASALPEDAWVTFPDVPNSSSSYNRELSMAGMPMQASGSGPGPEHEQQQQQSQAVAGHGMSSSSNGMFREEWRSPGVTGPALQLLLLTGPAAGRVFNHASCAQEVRAGTGMVGEGQGPIAKAA